MAVGFVFFCAQKIDSHVGDCLLVLAYRLCDRIDADVARSVAVVLPWFTGACDRVDTDAATLATVAYKAKVLKISISKRVSSML